MTNQIGILNEKPLHAALKAWYAQPSDKIEVRVDDYVVDIKRKELLIEIQTRNFSAIKRKMTTLSDQYSLRLVHPIPQEKWIIKVENDGLTPKSRRKSPKRGSYLDVFDELVSFPYLLRRPTFSLEILLIQEEEIRQYDPNRAWRRRGWVTKERRLLDVLDQRIFSSTHDMASFLPTSLVGSFTSSNLAHDLRIPSRLAGKMAYCLREMGAITPIGKKRNAILYERAIT